MTCLTEQKGRIHSFESFGTVDGPGIRFVVFFGGCPLRCKYCHNVDMQGEKSGKEYTLDQLLKMIVKNRSYYDASGGGVTFSGGEPTMQMDFLIEIAKKCQAAGIHTTVDTSLFVNTAALEKLIPHVDLFMVSLKHFDEKEHQKLIGVSNRLILENVRLLSTKKTPLRLRFVLLPGHTDTNANLKSLIQFCKSVSFEGLEVLPYHQMGLEKWKQLGREYELSEVSPPSDQEVEQFKQKLRTADINVL